MRAKFFLSVMAAAVLLSGCGQPAQPAQAPSASQPNGGTTSNTTASSITIQNFAFSPKTLDIAKGTTVTWVNQDSAVHSIVSPSFSSQTLHTGETFSFTFDQPGTYPYSCGIHPSMQGTVTVQ